jgi:glucose-6-phosphate isomerase
VRDYGFDYCGVRARGGLAWFPRFHGADLVWDRNPRYPVNRELTRKRPANYRALGLQTGVPIWRQYLDNPDSVMWVSDPRRLDHLWPDFVP